MVNQFTKGLNTDVDPLYQTEGTYRYALNFSPQSSQGNQGALSKTRGNSLDIQLANDETIVGMCNTDTDDIVVFISSVNTSKIGYYNANTKEFTTLIDTPDLNFSRSNPPIDALFRIRKGCERVIYFTDRTNPYRVINLSSLDQYKDENGNWDVDEFEYNRDFTYPSISIDSVENTGGVLPVGSYQFAYRYLDRDLNPTNWLGVTKSTWIYDEDTTADYDLIDGAINNYDNADPEPGAVPHTTKSIKLSFSGLSDNYTYIQIAVLKSISNTQSVTEAEILNKQFITSNTLDFTYRGTSGQVEQLISETDITIDNPIIEVVQTHAQKDNTLWLANVSEAPLPYAELQRAANKIKVDWISTKVDATNPLAPGSPKNPITPSTYPTMMGNEVYELGVQFLYPKGKWSPVFHIPGRESTPQDFDILPISDDYSHATTQEQRTAYKIESTATVEGSTDFGATGKLGYWESDQSYPDILCPEDGLRIFPTGKIRQHRMPSRRLLPTQEGKNTIQPIGLSFSNVEYPDDSIVGHRFVYARRTEDTSLVLDTGVTFPLKGDTTISGSNNNPQLSIGLKYEYLYYGNTDDREYGAVLLSPKLLVNSSSLNTSHYFQNYELDNRQVKEEKKSFGTYDVKNWLLDFQPLFYSDRLITRDFGLLFIDANTKEDGLDSLPDVLPDSFPVDLEYLDNASKTNRFPFIVLDKDYQYSFHRHVSLMQDIDPYPSLENLTYIPLDPNPTSNDVNETTVVYGGDTYISELVVNDTHLLENNRSHSNTTSRIFVESTINFSLTYGDEALPQYSKVKVGGDIHQHIANLTLELKENGDGSPLDTPYTTRYSYNVDYSKEANEKAYFPLPYTFSYCKNKCLNSYPYNLYYSKTSYQEETQDNYRIILPNNYTTFEGSSGAINKLFVDKDQLYVVTNRDLWFVPTKPQQIQSDEATIYLGTGEKLSIPPSRITSIDYNYLGSGDYNSFTSTEYGTLYTSSETGSVFLISDSPQEISQKGMYHFFDTNLQVNLTQQLKTIGQSYPYHNIPFHTNGVGVITSYDPILKVVYIHKRDYKPRYRLLLEEDNQRLYKTNNIYYKDGVFKYYNNLGSLPHQAWWSFHSFFPHYLHNDHLQMYSTQFNSLYSHNRLSPISTYYGTLYPSIIDAVVTSGGFVNHTFSSLRVSSFPKDTFFDHAILYNHNQSSGKIPIQIKDNPFIEPDTTYAELVDNNYRLSNFRDHVIDRATPVFSTDWEDIQSEYPIDKVPHPISIDTSKSLYQTERLKGEYLRIRLFSTSDSELHLNSIYTNQKLRQR